MNPTEQSNKTLSIYVNQGKLIIFLVIAGLLFWSCLTAIFSPIDGFLSFILKILSLPALIISGYSCYFLFQKLSKKIPSLVIDEKGIYDDVLPVSMDQILWEEIDFVEIYKFETDIPFVEQEILGIVLKDVHTFRQNKNIINQYILRINHWFPKLKAQINIPLDTIDANAEKVIAHIKSLHPEKVKEEKN